jgi:hypothetical protein
VGLGIAYADHPAPKQMHSLIRLLPRYAAVDCLRGGAALVLKDPALSWSRWLRAVA